MADEPTEQPATGEQATTSDPGNEASDNGNLGDAGRKALDEERKARRKAEADFKKLTSELEQLRAAGQSEQEKAVAEARKEGEKTGTDKAKGLLRRAAILTAAAGQLADPEDAVRLLDLDDLDVDDDGTINTQALTAAIAGLVKSKPYLAAAGSRPSPLPGGGATPSTGQDLDAVFMDALRGGLR